MILGAKVQLVRDAQVVEKVNIKKELLVEERRLDGMTELDRLNSVKMEEEIALKKKNENKAGAMLVMEQIKQHQEVTDIYIDGGFLTLSIAVLKPKLVATRCGL
jgi:DNA integrity scanning protein DisA with diadenylate cyclase activity